MNEHNSDSPQEAEVEFECPHCAAAQHCGQDGLGCVVHCEECGGAVLLPTADELAEVGADPHAAEGADVGDTDEAEEAAGAEDVRSWEGEMGGLDGKSDNVPVQVHDDAAEPNAETAAMPVAEREDHVAGTDALWESGGEIRPMITNLEQVDDMSEPQGSSDGRQSDAGIEEAVGSGASDSQEAGECPSITKGAGGGKDPDPSTTLAASQSPVSVVTKVKLPERRTGAGLRKELRQQMDLDGDIGVRTRASDSKERGGAIGPPPAHAESQQKGAAEPHGSETGAAPPEAEMAGEPGGEAGDDSVSGREPLKVSPRLAAPKGVSSFVKDPEMEKKRLFAAAGIGADGRLARVAGLDTLIFRCPDCSQQSVISGGVLGREISCEECGAFLKMPKDDKGRVELLARGCLSEREKRLLTPLPEPGEATPGGKKSPKLTPLGDVLVDRDADAAWGAEKKEVAAPRRKRRVLFLIPVVIAAVLVALLVIFARAPGRVSDEAIEGLRGAGVTPMGPSGELDWENMDRARRIEMATEAVRRFAESESLDDLTAASRPRDGLRESMGRHYESIGGYVSEVRRHGPLVAVQVVESRTLVQEPLLIVSTRFQGGASGTHVLFQAKDRYLVDWDYAVGYSEASMDDLREDPPANAVLMRGYLEEDVFFIHGFTADEWRMFDFHCPQMISSVVVYARRNSEVERKLREAWTDSGIQRVGLADGPATRLDFTLRLSHLDDGVRKGLVIDDVLTQGWILVD